MADLPLRPHSRHRYAAGCATRQRTGCVAGDLRSVTHQHQQGNLLTGMEAQFASFASLLLPHESCCDRVPCAWRCAVRARAPGPTQIRGVPDDPPDQLAHASPLCLPYLHASACRSYCCADAFETGRAHLEMLKKRRSRMSLETEQVRWWGLHRATGTETLHCCEVMA